MKTMFGRQFMLTACLLLICVVALGTAFRFFVGSYANTKACEALERNAAGIARLATPYDNLQALGTSWDMRINLSVASDVTGQDIDILICDPSGAITLCSCSSFFCEHLGATIDPRLMSQFTEAIDDRAAALEAEQAFARDNGGEATAALPTCSTNSKLLTALYSDDAARHIAAAPVLTLDGTQVFAYVVVSSSIDDTEAIITSATERIMEIGLCVLLLALLAISLLTRSQYQPLRDMAAAARRFGHGELDVRVPTGGNNPIEIDELAVAFNNMAVSLEQSELRRREFVANISHELKTPMTTIAGFMDGMLDGTIPPERHREYMQTVSTEVRRLSRLVRSMLEVSRLQSQGIPDDKKQIFDICEQAGQALVTFEQKINAKNLAVEVDFPDGPVEVFAEKDSITQVVYNLIDNAVKFCEPGGKLGLSVAWGDTNVVVTVSNTGPTIPENELPRIFERFHKTDKSRSTDRDGVGLGLYIVRTIILSHGEDITVTSRNGLTAFSFTLSLPK